MPQRGDFEAGGGHSRRLLAHGESLLGLEIVIQTHQIRTEPGPEGHLQEKHGLAGAEVLRQHSAGDRHHRTVAIKRRRYPAASRHRHPHDAGWRRRGVQVHARLHPRRGRAAVQRQRQRHRIRNLDRQLERSQ